jgi:hypothetical protein
MHPIRGDELRALTAPNDGIDPRLAWSCLDRAHDTLHATEPGAVQGLLAGLTLDGACIGPRSQQFVTPSARSTAHATIANCGFPKFGLV